MLSMLCCFLSSWNLWGVIKGETTTTNNKNTNKYQSIFLSASAFWFTAFQAPARQPAAAEGKEETYYSSTRGHCSQACSTWTLIDQGRKWKCIGRSKDLLDKLQFQLMLFFLSIYFRECQVASLTPCLYITLSQATEQKTKKLQFEAINIRSSELLALLYYRYYRYTPWRGHCVFWKSWAKCRSCCEAGCDSSIDYGR